MNFSSPQKIFDTLQAGDDVENVRSLNRVKINNAANGFPFLDGEQVKKLNIKVNVNFGELPRLFSHARRQYYNAFLKTGNFFKVSLPYAPPKQRVEWQTFITAKINRALKNSLPFFELYRSKFASVVAHGVGAQMWHDPETIIPSLLAIEDLRVPTDTTLAMENQPWIATRKLWTPGELIARVFGENSDRRWNKPAIAKILDDYKDVNYDTSAYTWQTSPEKLAELSKQNLGYLSSDAAPAISLWHFYFYDEESEGWELRVLPEQDTVKSAPEHEFLYDSEGPIAKKLGHFLHVQYGDLNNKAPFLYHSVRSLGFLLMEPCFWANLLLCRGVQHTMENFNIWLRSSDPQGKARAQKVEMFDRAFIPEGITIVPQTERHQVNEGFFDTIIGQVRELMQEASVTYTQDSETGRSPSREQTATETMARIQQVNALMSGLLQTAFHYETFAYQEMCRRFCLRNSSDPDAQEFQKACKKAGIPPQFVNVEAWDVEPEMPMGAGNPTLEVALTQQLLQLRPLYDATAQREILHDATVVFTGDVKKAQRWVPLDQERGVTESQRDAQLAFGTLMQGIPIPPKEELDPAEQIQVLLGMAAGVITRIEQQTNLASPNEMAGLQTVLQYIGGLIQVLSGNPQAKSQAKQFSDALGKLANSLRGFAQRLQQQQQQAAKAAQNGGNGNGGPNPAEMQATLQKAALDGKIAAAKANQALKHKQQGFLLDQRRKDAAAFAGIKRDGLKKRFAALEPE